MLRAVLSFVVCHCPSLDEGWGVFAPTFDFPCGLIHIQAELQAKPRVINASIVGILKM